MSKIPNFKIILFIFCLLFICNGNSSDKPKEKIIRLGFSSELFSGVNPRDAKAAIEMYALNMIEEMNKTHRFRYKASATIFNDNKELVQALKNKECDLLSLSIKKYSELKSEVALTPSLMINSSNEEYYILLVNQKIKINSLQDLKDKRLLVISGGRGDLGITWLGSVLMKSGFKDCSAFFKEIKRTDKQSQAILPVYFGQYDACVTLSSSFEEIIKLNPQINNKVTLLQKSKKVTWGLMCFLNTLSSEDKNIIIKTAKNLQNYTAGKQILNLFQLPSVQDVNFDYLNNVEEFLSDYQNFKQNTKSKKIK